MKEIAERALPAGVTSEDDFEILVGAFGAENRTMGYLEQRAALTQPQDEELQAAIKRVAGFATRVRDTGLSHVLQVIFENSHAYSDDAEHLHAFVRAISEGFDGRATLANLNYDTLLLSAVLIVCGGAHVAVTSHMGIGKCVFSTPTRTSLLNARPRSIGQWARPTRVGLAMAACQWWTRILWLGLTVYVSMQR